MIECVELITYKETFIVGRYIFYNAKHNWHQCSFAHVIYTENANKNLNKKTVVLIYESNRSIAPGRETFRLRPMEG